MQVPVFFTRQVFVKGELALIGLLSGIVTSSTKLALLVQSGELVGMGVSAVGALVSSVGCGVAVGVRLAVGAEVSVGADVAVSVAGCVPHDTTVNAIAKYIARNVFFMMILFSGRWCRMLLSLYTQETTATKLCRTRRCWEMQRLKNFISPITLRALWLIGQNVVLLRFSRFGYNLSDDRRPDS